MLRRDLVPGEDYAYLRNYSRRFDPAADLGRCVRVTMVAVQEIPSRYGWKPAAIEVIVAFRDVDETRGFATEAEAEACAADHPGATVTNHHHNYKPWSVQWMDAMGEPRAVRLRDLRGPWDDATVAAVAARVEAERVAAEARREQAATVAAAQAADLAERQRRHAIVDDARAAVRARFGLAPHDHRANGSYDDATGRGIAGLTLHIAADRLDALAAGLDDPEQVDWHQVLDLPHPHQEAPHG
jgi:hypothetical protein